MARPQRYLIALGSNVRHHRPGRPPEVLQAALAELQRRGVTIERSSAVMRSAPLGPSRRRYANAAAIVTTSLLPPDLLALCKRVEAALRIPRKTFRAHAEADDVPTAIDRVRDKLERQLRDHHGKKKAAQTKGALGYAQAAAPEIDAE